MWQYKVSYPGKKEGNTREAQASRGTEEKTRCGTNNDQTKQHILKKKKKKKKKKKEEKTNCNRGLPWNDHQEKRPGGKGLEARGAKWS